MQEIEKSKRLHDRLERYDRKRYVTKRKKLKERWLICEKFLVLAEKIKKPSSGRFYKQSVQNIFYFYKDSTFRIRKKPQSIDNIKYFWLTDAQNKKKLTKRSQRTELFASKGNFVM